MAASELGISKLEACNHMLSAVGLRPVSALDTSGTSDVTEAERILDRHTEFVQTEGFPGNMIKAQEYTAASTIDVVAGTLRVECVAPGRHAGNIVVRHGQLYSTAEGTLDFSGQGNLYCDTWYEVVWAQLPPDLKKRILDSATVDYFERTKQRESLGRHLMNNEARSDINADRIIEGQRPMPNQRPIIAPQGRES